MGKTISSRADSLCRAWQARSPSVRLTRSATSSACRNGSGNARIVGEGELHQSGLEPPQRKLDAARFGTPRKCGQAIPNQAAVEQHQGALLASRPADAFDGVIQLNRLHRHKR